MKPNKILLVIIALLAISLISCSESADDIISKNIKARGDDGTKKIKSVVAEIKIPSFTFDIPMKIYLVPPEKIRFDMQVLGKPVTTIINGNNGWMIDDSLHVLPTRQVIANKAVIKNQLNFYQSELTDYKEYTRKVESIDKDTLFGRKVYKIKLLTLDSLEKIVYIDADNFLNLKSDIIVELGKEKFVNETIYKNYKQVQGYMVPFLIEIRENGKNSGKIVIDKITMNEPINDSMFQPPSNQ